MKKQQRLSIVLVLIFTFILTACNNGGQSGDPTATPEPFFPTASESTAEAILPLNPTPTPNLNNPNPIRITELEYFQEADGNLTVMAKLFNTLNDAILRDVQLEVLVLDVFGNRLAVEYPSFRYLFPNETSSMVQKFTLNMGLEITNVEVRIIDGLIDRSLKYKQPLTISESASFQLQDGNAATGWLRNSDPYTYTQVILNAIAYSPQGQIVGGGQATYDFVPQKDQIGFSIPLSLREESTIARVDVSPWLTSYSASLESGNWWKSISTEEWNFAVDRYNQITGGAIFKNETDQVLTETFAILTVSDQDNRVCYASKNYYDIIWPKEKVSYSITPEQLPEDCQGSSVDLVLVPGEFGEFPVDFNPLQASQAVFSDPETVSLSIVNNLNAAVSQTRVYVVLRDPSGRIVGGGYQTSENIRSASATSVSVPVAYLGIQEELSIFAFATLPAEVQFGQ
jgi:hypothetical protein